MTFGVEIVLRPEQCDIRFGFIVVVQRHRTLDSNDHIVAESASEDAVCAIDTRAMRWSDRTHREDLSVNEFHVIPFSQDPGFNHAMVIVDGKEPAFDFCWHKLTPAYRNGNANENLFKPLESL